MFISKRKLKKMVDTLADLEDKYIALENKYYKLSNKVNILQYEKKIENPYNNNNFNDLMDDDLE